MTDDQPKRDFDSEPEEFPLCWESGEDEIIIDVQGLINKHVWLALKEYAADSRPSFHIEEDGSTTVFNLLFDGDRDMGGEISTTCHIEPLVMEIERNDYGADELQKAAASFRRCADYLESLLQPAKDA